MDFIKKNKYWIIILGACLLLLAMGCFIWFVPFEQVSLDKLKTADQNWKEYHELVNMYRQNFAQIALGVFILLGAGIQFWRTKEFSIQNKLTKASDIKKHALV